MLEGLAPLARDELQRRLGAAVRMGDAPRPDALGFTYRGPLADLLELRSVVAVSLVHVFPVPRPKALLGHQHWVVMAEMIGQAMELWPPGRFQSLRLSAAGAESSVMQRIQQEIAQHTGLRPDADEGDLLLRLRRAPDGWELLVRLSPRPLATRPWRVANMPGALNASLAHAMAQLTQPSPADRVVNLMCGSGTLLVERLALARAALALGCDTDPAALECARQNLAAAQGYELPHGQPVRLEPWDATAVPMPDASFDVLLADLPFGQLIGSHRENEETYPRLMAEATRLAAPGARMALITHEVRLLEHAAAPFEAHWALQDVIPVRSGGMTPRIFLWRRER